MGKPPADSVLGSKPHAPAMCSVRLYARCGGRATLSTFFYAHHLGLPWRRARSVVYMRGTGAQPSTRECTFVDALHECKGAHCAGQVLKDHHQG